MAEMQDMHQAGAFEQSGSTLSIVNILGAVTSLVLVAGVCVWGYQQLSRDVSGVPVIRAADGPMRVQPEDPDPVAIGHGMAGRCLDGEALVGAERRPHGPTHHGSPDVSHPACGDTGALDLSGGRFRDTHKLTAALTVLVSGKHSAYNQIPTQRPGS